MRRRTTKATMQHEQNCKGYILQIYRQAAKEHLPCQWIQDTVKRRVYMSAQWPTMTNLQQESIFGYSEGLATYFWHDVCENRVWYNDQYIPSSEVPEGEWHNVKPGACVYKDSPQIAYANFGDIGR